MAHPILTELNKLCFSQAFFLSSKGRFGLAKTLTALLVLCGCISDLPEVVYVQ